MDKELPAMLSWTYPHDSDETIAPPPKSTQPSTLSNLYDYDKLIVESG